MFNEQFDLIVNPFGITSSLDFLFKSTAFEESMAHLIYGLDNGEAIVMITGPIGSGKTMSLQSFLTNLGDKYEFALVTNTQVTHVELLKLILDDLDIELDPRWDKSDLLIAFKDYLINARKNGHKVIVVIDEAQNLNSEVLEEVRLLTNLGQGSEQLVQLILVGQPELKEIVKSPELAQLKQRIRVHYEVETLTYDEMVGYVNHRMEVAGCTREVFKSSALKKLFEISGGVPRLVNTHAGNAILSAYVANRSMVTTQDVEEGVDENRVDGPAPEKRAIAAPKKKKTGSRALWLLLGFLVLSAPLIWYFFYYLESPALPENIRQTDTVSLTDVTPEVPDSVDSTKVSEPVIVLSETNDTEDSLIIAIPVPKIEEVTYFIHVASFQDLARSEGQLERFKHDSLSGFIKETEVDGVKWFRLLLGPMLSKDEAESVGNRLRDEGVVGYYGVQKISSVDDDGNKGL